MRRLGPQRNVRLRMTYSTARVRGVRGVRGVRRACFAKARAGAHLSPGEPRFADICERGGRRPSAMVRLTCSCRHVTGRP
jgi:hypothetical protein